MMRIKELSLVFVIILTVFSSFGIASASCGTGDDSQLIFRMHNNTNSHTAVYDEDLYRKEICYTDFFDQSYDVSSGLRDCTDEENWLFNLSDDINSHASHDAAPGYNIDICYGGFKDCDLISSIIGCNEANNENAIVYLSARTNAHLSRVPNTLYYPFVLCCVGKAGKPISTDFEFARCSDYKIESSCTANAPLGRVDPSCPEDRQVECSCEWVSGKCAVVYTEGDCKCIKTPSDICDANNEMEIIATIEGDGCSAEEGWCVSGQKVPCVFELSELPFFGGWQFAVSLIAIALLYSIFYKRK